MGWLASVVVTIGLVACLAQGAPTPVVIQTATMRYKENGFPALHEGMKHIRVVREDLPKLAMKKVDQKCDAVMDYDQYADVIALLMKNLAPESLKDIESARSTFMGLLRDAKYENEETEQVCVDSSLMKFQALRLEFPEIELDGDNFDEALAKHSEKVIAESRARFAHRSKANATVRSIELDDTAERWSPSGKSIPPGGWAYWDLRKFYVEDDAHRRCPWSYDHLMGKKYYHSRNPAVCPGEYANYDHWENVLGPCSTDLLYPLGFSEDYRRYNKNGVSCQVWQRTNFYCYLDQPQQYYGCGTMDKFHQKFIDLHTLDWPYDHSEEMHWSTVQNNMERYYCMPVSFNSKYCEYFNSYAGHWHTFCDMMLDMISSDVRNCDIGKPSTWLFKRCAFGESNEPYGAGNY